jgi:hypothetical protein
MQGAKGAKAQAQIARDNYDLSLRNYYLNREATLRAQELARAGQTDARGNQLVYVEGVGWVERPTATTRGILQAEDAENMQRLTGDAIRARMGRSNQFTRGLTDGANADAILSGMNEGQQSIDDLRSGLARAKVARAVSGGNNARRVLNLNALRGGAGGVGAADIARNNVNDTRTALEEARLEAPGEATVRRTARINGAVSPYQALTRGLSPVDGPGSTSALADMLAKRGATAQQGAAYASNNAGRLGFNPTAVPTDNSAVAWAGIGNAISNAPNSQWYKSLSNWLSNRNAAAANTTTPSTSVPVPEESNNWL